MELRAGNQSGGQTVTLLVLPLNGFWLGFERQRLEASPIGELEQVLSMERLAKLAAPKPLGIHTRGNPSRVTTQAMFTRRVSYAHKNSGASLIVISFTDY